MKVGIIMLKMIKKNKMETPEEIEKEYPKCMYILTDFTDINNMKGHLYAISQNQQSFHELCVLSDKLSDEGKTAIIMGEYDEEGIMLGVQREIKG